MFFKLKFFLIFSKNFLKLILLNFGKVTEASIPVNNDKIFLKNILLLFNKKFDIIEK